MNAESLIKQISELPPALQAQVADFVEFLSTRDKLTKQPHPSPELGELVNDPAIGMWADREDMRDGVEWVRRLRESEWAGGGR